MQVPYGRNGISVGGKEGKLVCLEQYMKERVRLEKEAGVVPTGHSWPESFKQKRDMM